MVKHPYECPFAQVTWNVPTDASEDGETEDATSSWDQRKPTPPQAWPWVDAAGSRQWEAFQESLRILKSRGNRVFVLVGPFNPYVMQESSRTRYLEVRGQMETWLRANHADFLVAPDLPSREYGDSCHPLKEGYRMVAEALVGDRRFQRWLAR